MALDIKQKGRYENSYELYKQALNIMPGGVNSPVRAFNAVKKHGGCCS